MKLSTFPNRIRLKKIIITKKITNQTNKKQQKTKRKKTITY